MLKVKGRRYMQGSLRRKMQAGHESRHWAPTCFYNPQRCLIDCRSLRLLWVFDIPGCPSLFTYHFLCAQQCPHQLVNPHGGVPVRLHKLHWFPRSVDMSKLTAGGRRQSTQRGSISYSNIAFESVLDYFNKKFLSQIKTTTFASNSTDLGVFTCLILNNFKNK